MAREALAASAGAAPVVCPAAAAPVGEAAPVDGDPDEEDGLAVDDAGDPEGELAPPDDPLDVPSELEGELEEGLEGELGLARPLGLVGAPPELACWVVDRLCAGSNGAAAPPSGVERVGSTGGATPRPGADPASNRSIPDLVGRGGTRDGTGADDGDAPSPGTGVGERVGSGGGCHISKGTTCGTALATIPVFNAFVATTHACIAASFSAASRSGELRVVLKNSCAYSRF